VRRRAGRERERGSGERGCRSSSSSSSREQSGCCVCWLQGMTETSCSMSSHTTASTPLSRCRRSTSDLTDLVEEPPSSPGPYQGRSQSSSRRHSISRPRSPSVAGTSASRTGLAYLASRRSSRDSQASQASEELGPLAFNRYRQRRTSNFLELPGASLFTISFLWTAF
jgi:hypothetical protein